MSRKSARRSAFEICYQMSFYDISELKNILSVYYAENENARGDEGYITGVVTGIFENLGEIDELIRKSSNKWEPDRIGKVDMAIMRVCVYEMLHMDDIPVSVSINEAIELAKRYGTDESPAFVNGILGGVNKHAGK